MTIDKRREAEIRAGAALNAIEPMEDAVDELLAGVICDATSSGDVIRELVLARHHIYRARCRAAWVLEQITHAPRWLETKSDLDDGTTALSKAASHCDDVLTCFATARSRFMENRNEPLARDDLWERIWERVGVLRTSVAEAVAALQVAKITATEP